MDDLVLAGAHQRQVFVKLASRFTLRLDDVPLMPSLVCAYICEAITILVLETLPVHDLVQCHHLLSKPLLHVRVEV